MKFQILNNKLFFSAIGILVFSLLSQLAFAHGMSEADKLAIIEGGNLSYLWLGATHMLTGYDHLAFVFGIIFFLNNFRDIAKYVTAFTVGHSVTLIYATFNGIQLNYYLIDAVIALSVCYIAFANIDGFRKYLNIKAPNMLLMIIGLGLIHGFGLSTRLQELPLSADSLLLNILSFNLGIELGQISALALMLLLISSWRKYQGFKTFSLVTNYVLILSGALLFFMQMFDYAESRNRLEVIATAEASQKASNRPTDKTSRIKSMPEQWQDIIHISIPARDEKEYKFYVEKNATFEYAWSTQGSALFYDFHGEPADDKTGYLKSFKKSTDNQSSGSLTALFSGTHGWYWKNTSLLPVVISLKSKGDYQRMDLKKPKLPTQTILTTHDTL